MFILAYVVLRTPSAGTRQGELLSVFVAGELS